MISDEVTSAREAGSRDGQGPSRVTRILAGRRHSPLDRVTAIAARLFHVPVALVTCVDGDKVHLASYRGLHLPSGVAGAMRLEQSIWRHVIDDAMPIVIPDLAQDARGIGSDAISELGVRSYLGVPVHAPNGDRLGSLCILDAAGRVWTGDEVLQLVELAALADDAIRLTVEVHTHARLSAQFAVNQEILEQVTSGASLTTVMDTVARRMEALMPGSHCSILVLSRDGQFLRDVAGPTLPASYRKHIDGVPALEGVGTCGTAAATGEIAVTRDINEDDRWLVAREAANEAGLRSCWSMPIVDGSSEVLGTFGIYHETPSEPTGADRDLIHGVVAVTAMAIERIRSQSHERMLAAVVAAAPDFVAVVSLGGKILYANSAALRLSGLAADEAYSAEIATVHPPWAEALIKDVGVPAAIRVGQWRGRTALLGSDGVERPVEQIIMVHRDERGEQAFFSTIIQDLSDGLRVQRELEDQAAQLRLALDAARMATWEWRFDDGNRLVASPEVNLLFGAPPDADITQTFRDAVEPEDYRDLMEASNQARLTGDDRFSRVLRLRSGSRTERWVEVHGAIERGPDLSPRRIVGVVLDVSTRELMDVQLRHSQKMEAVGQLAGGIAHDFNNLLTVIGANASFLSEAIPPAMVEAREEAREIEEAVRRASALTRQLLVFSRQETLTPAVVVLDHLLAALEQLLRRVVVDDIALSLLPGAPDTSILADATQIEQVVVNLCVNARDAMSGGGVLTIETKERSLPPEEAALRGLARSGSYVELKVSDTGCGMDSATMARAFEPFFTTKPAGSGTGLGLAIVYGIVVESGGNVSVQSTVGVGTTFTVLLPAVSGEPIAVVERPSVLRGAGEVVLVVEDEQNVRAVVSRTLRHLGYHVLEARHGADALSIWRDEGGPEGRIALVLSDITMPEMGGAALAAALRSLRPAQAIACMTGYADGVARAEVEALGISFLDKPFTTLALARLVHEQTHDA